jgi:hypothetical protein
MSLLKTNAFQLGQSLTANNNFVWYQPEVPDGTIRLAVGNSGSNADILTVNSSGFINVTGSVGASNATFTGTDAIKLPSGTSEQRPTGSESLFRYNNENKNLEFYDGIEWRVPGGALTLGRIYFSGSL